MNTFAEEIFTNSEDNTPGKLNTNNELKRLEIEYTLYRYTLDKSGGEFILQASRNL